MAIDWAPWRKKQLLAVIGDTGDGMPFDSIRLSMSYGRATLSFCQAGNEMVHVTALPGETATVMASGKLEVMI